MVITLKLGEPLSEIVGEKSIAVEANGAHTIADVLAEVNRRYPNFSAGLKSDEFDLPYTIFRNDALVHWEQIAQTAVEDGDKIFLMMPVSGG